MYVNERIETIARHKQANPDWTGQVEKAIDLFHKSEYVKKWKRDLLYHYTRLKCHNNTVYYSIKKTMK